MAVHLRAFNKPSHVEPIGSADFLHKNKIVVNNPKQTHFSVEGVQSYTADEVKALKFRADRNMENKEGTFAPMKTFLLSEQVFDEEPEPSAKKVVENKSKEKVKPRPKSRINPRNAVSTNNQAVIKIEKQKKVRDNLQRKLDKLQKHYKEHFKGVDLKEEQKAESEAADSVAASEEEREYEPEISESKEQSTTFQHSFGRKPRKSIADSRIEEEGDSKELKLGFNMITQCSSYSERLGAAVHEMFK